MGSGSADRVFIDEYAVDGLRAMALVKYFFGKDDSISHQSWTHPLGDFGYKVAGSKIKLNDESIKFFKTLEARGNPVACADFVGSVTLESEELDFRNLSISKGAFSSVDFAGKSVKNIAFSYCEFMDLTLDSYEATHVSFEKCLFDKIIGVTSMAGLPTFFSDCEVVEFEDVLTVSRISELNISDGHKTLLSIIKKLFFQPGKGRKEEALLRGTEKYWDAKTAERLLKIMITDGMVDKFKGDDGWVYSPTRSKTVRAKRIMSKLGNCGDPLWGRV